jgi:thiol-disulfide isomerase/thioredoxin
MRRNAKLTMLAGVAGLLLGCAGSGAEQRRSERGAALVGSPLVLAAPDLQGCDVDIAALSGQVRVIDFWATWCEPCKEAMPVLDGIARELGPRGVRVFGISIDDDPAQIARYLGERPVSFPILWDKDSARLNRLGVSFMPVTLLVDRRGVIRHVHQGWDSRRAQVERAEVEALLREP